VALSPFTVRWPFWAYETVRLAIIMTLAFASWYLVEQPLMEWRRKRFASGGPEAATKQASEARIPAAAPP
jgi:peptidoglycan/LPS O-acetylase OafA/YrhL